MSNHPTSSDPTATGGSFAPTGSELDAGSAPLDFQARLLRLAESGGIPDAGSTPNPSADATASGFPAIPGYRIHAKIGRGGMGDVYEATDERLKVRVALKVLPDRLDEDDEGRDNRNTATRERFANEAATLAQFDHPNIVRVYAAGEANGWLYFAMRLLPNGALNRHLAAARTSAAAVARLLATIARAVQHLHDKKVVHRDLKPHNILMGDGGEPQVADFGVAKWAGGRATVGFVRLGTYAYMAPEMIALGSAGCGPEVDVWAMGVMLFELLAGERPFVGGTEPELLDRVANAAPPPFADAVAPVSGIDDWLEAITLRALAKDPARRYPTAAALADDLDRWLGRDPSAVPAPLPLAELRRNATAYGSADTTVTAAVPPRRRRWRVAFAAGVLLLSVAAVIALTWPYDRADAASPSPAHETVLEEFNRLGEVVIVDAEGNVRHELTTVAGSAGGPPAQMKGYLQASGSALALYEIAAIPPPFRLKAKVHHPWGAAGQPAAFVGLYARRAGWPLPGEQFEEHDLHAVGLETASVVGNPKGEAAEFPGLLDLNQAVRVRFLQLRSPTPPAHERAVDRHPIGSSEFRELILDVYSDKAVGQIDGVPFPSTSLALATVAAKSVRVTENRLTPRRPFGDGLGLIVTRGTAWYRDVVICRIP